MLNRYRSVKRWGEEPSLQIEVVTKFICDGVVKAVISSILGVPTDFVLDPNASGKCKIETTAPYNSSTFTKKVSRLKVVVLVPVYYEGAVDSVLYSGQVINNYLRASDDSSSL